MLPFILIAYLNWNYAKPEPKPEPMVIQTEVQYENEDQRVATLQAYLAKKGSPMAENAKDFIEAANTYGLDWKLLPSISGAESGFGKHVPSCASYNGFGWISTASPCGYWRFESYSEAIHGVAKGIGTKSAYSQYRETRSIERLAIPYSGGSAHWVEMVNWFMNDIENFKNDTN